MEQRWNLDALYPSFESALLKEDMASLKEKIDHLLDWTKINFQSNEQASEKMKFFINAYNEIGDLMGKLHSFGSLTYSVNTSDAKAMKLMEKLENLFPELTKIEVKCQKWLSQLSNVEELIHSDSLLKEHAFFIEEMQKKATYLLSEEEENLIALMKNTGSNAWAKLQQSLTSKLLVPIELKGEKKQLPLSIVRSLAYDKDSETRKTAYEAELKAYSQIQEGSSACLNAIKGEVITVSKKKGYASPLDKTLLDSRMDKETLDAMISAIKEYLPAFRKYLNKKAEILGHKNGLPFYDLFAPIGDVHMHYTYEEAQKFIIDNFTNFSKALGQFAKRAFEDQWIDAEPREGKVGGAFCDNLHAIKQSRIMANFTGSFNDVTTLAHELGHGYHGECLKDVTYLNSDYPMPLAETASIFCETIVIQSALKTASKEETLVILENHLMSATQVIVDILSRYLFETELFKRREESSVSVEELKEIMTNAQKEAYGEGLDEDYLHPYMWVCKPHYYYFDANFYNFPYAFGLLFAKGLYAKYLEMGDAFIEKYDALLEATGHHSIHDVLKIMSIDSHSVDFFKSSLEIIKKDIDTFCSLA